MEKLSIKTTIESIIEDLSYNIPLTRIFNKVQALAYHLDNVEFSRWVKYEREGYPEKSELPEYRKIILDIYVSGHSMSNKYSEYRLPPGILKDDDIEKVFRTYCCRHKLALLEPYIRNIDGDNIYTLPSIIYPYVKRCFRGFVVDEVYYKIPHNFYIGLLDTVNSKLLDFMLQINDNIGDEVNFDVMTKKKEIDTIAHHTIYAGVVNMGSGSIEISNSPIVGGQNNTVTIHDDYKDKIQDIVNKIEILSQDIEEDRTDIAEVVLEIKNELNKRESSPKVLRIAFNAIKGLSSKFVGKGIETLAEEAIKSLV